MSQEISVTQNTLLVKIRSTTTLPVLALVGLTLRLFFLRYRFAAAFDEINYLKLGVSGYLNGLGDILHTYWSPLLPGLIALSCNVVGDYELAGRLVSVLAGAALVFPVYFLAKTIYSREVGLVASAFVSVFPPLAFQSTQVLTEPIFMLAGTLAVLFGLRTLEQTSWRSALLAGGCSALAYLAHPQGIGFFVVIVGWCSLGIVFKIFGAERVRSLYSTGMLIVTFLAVSAPYLVFLKRQTGEWTLSAKASANMQMDAPKTEEGDPFRSLDPSNRFVPLDQIFHQGNFLKSQNSASGPVREVRLAPLVTKYVKNLADILRKAIPEFLTTIPLVFLGIGLFGSAWPAWKGVALLYLLSFVALYWFGVIPAFHINLRYFSPLWPLCSIWVAKGAVHIWQWLAGETGPFQRFSSNKLSSGTLAAVTVTAAFFVMSFLPEFGRVISRQPGSPEYWADPVDQKKAGLWLRENVNGPKITMSRYHTADFYAGNYDIAQSITLPRSSLDRVLKYAAHRGAKFLLLNERYIQWYPQMRFLLNGSDGYGNLRLIYKDVDAAGLSTVIYEIVKEE